VTDSYQIEAENRGQSAIDFLIGFGIFFVTFTFVIVLIPDLLSPFAQQEGPVVADRAVETLSSDLLASGTVGVLNDTCTDQFFQGSGTDCSFDASDRTTTLLGVSDKHGLNVTLERTDTGDQRLARGLSPPGDTQSVRTARRLVRVYDQHHILKLRVW
jgi:hypothetical protein